MGQQQGHPARAARPGKDVHYRGCSVEDLQRMAAERGLSTEVGSMDGLLRGAYLDRSTWVAILKAFDAGAQAAGRSLGPGKSLGMGCGATEPGCGRCECNPEPPMDEANVVQQILSAPGLKGVDIGGTLVKMVLALPKEAADLLSFPGTFGATGRTHSDLELDLDLCGGPCVLRFISGATAQVTSTVTGLQRQRRSCGALPMDDPSEEAATDDLEPVEHPKRVFTAGGGAHKFAPLFRDALDIELVPVKELSAVVDGLLFLADCGKGSRSVCEQVYTLDETGKPEPTPWPEQLFPFLVVNIGSGVSILRVDSAEEGGYTRVGGTACGGATFLGLARALTSARSFEEALHLAEQGDATCCDLLVRDIYGEEGSNNLGLPGGLTASNCGRLCEDLPEGQDGCSEQDLARSLLQMVTQQAVLLSGAFARQANCVDRVFFAGGFVEEANRIARKAIAANFRSLGGRAYFLRHSDFLGALGSLRSCVQDAERVPLAAALLAERGCSCGWASPSSGSKATASRSWSTASCSSASSEGP